MHASIRPISPARFPHVAAVGLFVAVAAMTRPLPHTRPRYLRCRANARASAARFLKPETTSLSMRAATTKYRAAAGPATTTTQTATSLLQTTTRNQHWLPRRRVKSNLASPRRK
jgi:hypothetical protein